MPRTFSIASLTTACLAAACFAPPVLAQGVLRPAETLIVNPESRPVPVVDRPLATAINALASTGSRTPYQHAVRFNQSLATCTQFVCEVNFPAVPAGKLLVVTYAAASYASPAANVFPRVELGDPHDAVLLPAPVSTGPGSFIASGPVTFYFAAGRTPRLWLGGIGVGAASNTALASIVGHLIDAPQ